MWYAALTHDQAAVLAATVAAAWRVAPRGGWRRRGAARCRHIHTEDQEAVSRLADAAQPEQAADGRARSDVHHDQKHSGDSRAGREDDGCAARFNLLGSADLMTELRLVCTQTLSPQCTDVQPHG